MDLKRLCQTGTYLHEELSAQAWQLQITYPFVQVKSIGRSVEGRNLWALGIGSGNPKTLFVGGVHANEWITSPLLMKFFSDYCSSLQRVGSPLSFDTTFTSGTLWVVPLLNPDGAELVQKGIKADNPRYSEVIKINGGSTNFNRWKSNIRGVDLNHQFPAAWNVQAAASPKKPSPRDYAGPSPLSESEAEAIAGFTREESFDTALAFHTQGEVIYWGYRGLEPAKSSSMVQELARLSGYRAIRYAGTHAGYKDWFIQEFRRPGFTVEVGRGTNPLSIALLPQIYARVHKMLLWCVTQR